MLHVEQSCVEMVCQWLCNVITPWLQVRLLHGIVCKQRWCQQNHLWVFVWLLICFDKLGRQCMATSGFDGCTKLKKAGGWDIIIHSMYISSADGYMNIHRSIISLFVSELYCIRSSLTWKIHWCNLPIGWFQAPQPQPLVYHLTLREPWLCGSHLWN